MGRGLDLRWVLLLVILISGLFSGCAEKVPSPETEREFKHYQEVLENATKPKEPSPQVKRIEPIFKELSPLQKKITVAFYQEYYENIFYFLALEAGLSLVLDPTIKLHIPSERERVTLQMKSQPIEEILKTLCDILDVDFKLERGVLYIRPYAERTFSLDFLPVVKESRSSLGGDVLGNVGGGTTGGGGGGATGGGATISSSGLKGEFSVTANLAQSNLDIYTALEREIAQIISRTQGGLTVQRGATQPSGGAQPPQPGGAQPQAQAPVLTGEEQFSLNRLTGTLYVRAKPSKVKSVADLVAEYKRRYGKQIIVDAKIVEIALSKDHDVGVDWVSLVNFLMGINRVAFDTLSLKGGTRPGEPVTLTISGEIPEHLIKQYRSILEKGQYLKQGQLELLPGLEDLVRQNITDSVQASTSLLLNLLRQYGEVKIISNPKIRVLHGQPALISVGTSTAFIKEWKRTITYQEGRQTEDYSVVPAAVFDGILLGLTPFISEKGEVILHIVPIKSDVVALQEKSFGINQLVTLPIVNLREMTSIVKARPNDLIVIGGLILEKNRGIENKLAVPGLSEVVKRNIGQSSKSEMAILLRIVVD